MTEDSFRHRVYRRVESARSQSARSGRSSERSPPLPPALGDLWVLPDSADYGIEWMILEHQDEDRCLLVAADTFPLACTEDVAVPTDAGLGPLRLRPRFQVTVPTAKLSADRYSGRVPVAVVEEVRANSAGLSMDRGATQLLDEPSYERWVAESLEPATQVLRNLEINETQKPPTPKPNGRPPVNPRPWPRFLVAAAMATVVTGLVALTWVQARQIKELEATQKPSGNLPMVWLGDDESMRSAKPVSLASGESHVVLLMIEPPELADRYRLDVLDPEGNELWTSGEMTLGKGTELAVLLPVGKLNGIELRARLFGLTDGTATSLAEYPLEVTTE